LRRFRYWIAVNLSQLLTSVAMAIGRKFTAIVRFHRAMILKWSLGISHLNLSRRSFTLVFSFFLSSQSSLASVYRISRLTGIQEFRHFLDKELQKVGFPLRSDDFRLSPREG
jgi:ABC-type lipoprotein release transport system permease subunit